MVETFLKYKTGPFSLNKPWLRALTSMTPSKRLDRDKPR
jgi:hypothetical protein